MPVRTLKKSYRGQPSWFQSRKAEREVFCESNLERDFYYLLEFFDWVVTFEEQPLTLPYLDVNEQGHHYTPDTRAHLRLEESDEQWLYEVKFRSDLRENWAEYKPKFQGAISYCRKNGFDRFKIMTEVEIRGGAKLKNVKRFLKKRYAQVDAGLIHYTLSLLTDCVTMDTCILLESLRTQGVKENEANVALAHLIATHRIGLDLDIPFTYSSELWLNPN